VRTICIIPARGNSQRIPRKNIKLFHGKPIIEYSIETAKKSRLFDQVVVSTDDPEIYQIAMDQGAVVHVRAPDDGSRGTQEIAGEVLRQPDYYAGLACVMYATAPLLKPGHLFNGLQHLMTHKELRYAYSVDAETGQDIGGFYWGFGFCFAEGQPLDINDAGCQVGYAGRVLIPSRYCCDINTPEDWTRAEEMYAALNQ